MGQNAGSITNVYANGNVSGDYDSIGGLVGANDGGTINTSYATGSVSGSGSNVGGLVGYNSGTVNSSYATGSVSASMDHGYKIGGAGGNQLWQYQQ